MAKERRKDDICHNCGEKLTAEDNYCPKCGQENNSKIVSLKALLNDFLSDYFTFDSKIFKSIIPLLFQPGKLTKEFNAGKRVKYIPPVRMYILISILYFFTLSLLNRPEGVGNDGVSTDLFELSANVTDSVDSLSGDSVTSPIGISFDANGEEIQYDSPRQLKEDVERMGVNNYLDSLNVEGPLQRLMVKQTIKIAYQGIESALDDFVQNISIMMFFLMPVFGFFLKLFYWRLKRFYIEHLVFSFHLHSFIFLLNAVYLLFSIFIWDIYHLGIALLLILIYAGIALKSVYDGGWGKTIVKLLFLTLSYAVIALAFTIGNMFVTLMLF